jgi:hypothetical protein
VVEHLASKHEALSSNPGMRERERDTERKKEKEKEKEKKKNVEYSTNRQKVLYSLDINLQPFS